jgi:hypothetical protein
VAKLSEKPTPHASRRRRAESSTARGRLSLIAEAARPSGAPAVGHRMAARGLLMFAFASATVQTSGARRRLGGRKTFPPCKPLKTNEIGLESRQIIPVRRTPMRRRRLSSRTERSRDASRSGSAEAGAKSQRRRAPALSRPGQSVASSRSRTFAASSSKENGLPIRCTPASSRPWWTIALRV